MRLLVLVLVVVTASAVPTSKPSRGAGTGWRGKLSSWLPGPLARRLAFNTATGYGTDDKCILTMDACPAAKESVCTGMGAPAKTSLCPSFSPMEADRATAQEQLYTWAAAQANNGQAAGVVFNIASGETWNQWGAAADCGPNGCANIYTKAILAYDDANCWPKSMAVPILVNTRNAAHSEQLMLCFHTVKHLLGKKPLGAFLRSPVEQLAHVVANKVMFTCGNTKMSGGSKDMTVAQYPYLAGEGGGGTAGSPAAFAESTGMCGAWNTELKDQWKTGGIRFGGVVSTEEYGHTIFDVAIAQYDPQGWVAVQRAERKAYNRWVADNTVGHERDADWDCNTAATEYFAAGVDLVLHNVRIGENHKATTRTQLKTTDPELWCLALRHYEMNNKFTPCPDGPAMTDVVQDVDCKTILGAIGVTVFGPDGSGGANGGGAKTVSTEITSSSISCPADPMTCAAYVVATTTAAPGGVTTTAVTGGGATTTAAPGGVTTTAVTGGGATTTATPGGATTTAAPGGVTTTAVTGGATTTAVAASASCVSNYGSTVAALVLVLCLSSLAD